MASVDKVECVVLSIVERLRLHEQYEVVNLGHGEYSIIFRVDINVNAIARTAIEAMEDYRDD